jgi:hypothetical protein
MRTPKNPKTPEQLKREIAYFSGVIHRLTSRDRIRRAHVAIKVRERQLAVALRVQYGRSDLPR